MKTKTMMLLVLLVLGVVLGREAQAYYNPSTGRWLSRDPVGSRGGLNLAAFVGNSVTSQYDYLGLTIPGQCAQAYANYCPCKCRGVRVSFSPGEKSFEWDWIPLKDGKAAFGNDMHVVWEVDGPAYRCKFSQLESGVFRFQNLTNPQAKDKRANWSAKSVPNSLGTSCWGTRAYTDYVGATFVPKVDDGDWITTTEPPPAITLQCESTDGSKMVHKVNVPPPPDPGRFPR